MEVPQVSTRHVDPYPEDSTAFVQQQVQQASDRALMACLRFGVAQAQVNKGFALDHRMVEAAVQTWVDLNGLPEPAQALNPAQARQFVQQCNQAAHVYSQCYRQLA